MRSSSSPPWPPPPPPPSTLRGDPDPEQGCSCTTAVRRIPNAPRHLVHITHDFAGRALGKALLVAGGGALLGALPCGCACCPPKPGGGWMSRLATGCGNPVGQPTGVPHTGPLQVGGTSPGVAPAGPPACVCFLRGFELRSHLGSECHLSGSGGCVPELRVPLRHRWWGPAGTQVHEHKTLGSGSWLGREGAWSRLSCL